MFLFLFCVGLFLLKKDNTRKYMGLKIANKQNLRKYKNVRVNRFSKTNLRSVATSRKKRCEQKKTARDMIEKAFLLNFYMQVANHRTNRRVYRQKMLEIAFQSFLFSNFLKESPPPPSPNGSHLRSSQSLLRQCLKSGYGLEWLVIVAPQGHFR